jgi:2-polyprenyl-6-methoxyphenol hydroxylase-like FAD-dependent oxidoreductase
MMNSKLHPAPLMRKGVVPIGDTWNMRHPLTGGGMTVALSDVATMSDAFAAVPDLKDISGVQTQMREFMKTRKPLASTINILSWALYGVFAGASDGTKNHYFATKTRLLIGCMKQILKLFKRSVMLVSGISSWAEFASQDPCLYCPGTVSL